jgi:hypothetical protein
VDIQADPPDPGAGSTTLLTVTVSGSAGGDRYAVPNVPVRLELSEKPDDASTLSATDLTTDVTGSATARLTLSRTRGRNVIKATSGSVTKQMVIDTLAGSRAGGGRVRHSAGVLNNVIPPIVSPWVLVGAAGVVLAGGFLMPYRRRLLGHLPGRRRPATPAAPVSSGRKPPEARRSAAPGG